MGIESNTTWRQKAASIVTSIPGAVSSTASTLSHYYQNLSPVAQSGIISAGLGTVGWLTGFPFLGTVAATGYSAYQNASRVYSAIFGSEREHIPDFAERLDHALTTTCPENGENLEQRQIEFSQTLNTFTSVATPNLCRALSDDFNQRLRERITHQIRDQQPLSEERRVVSLNNAAIRSQILNIDNFQEILHTIARESTQQLAAQDEQAIVRYIQRFQQRGDFNEIFNAPTPAERIQRFHAFLGGMRDDFQAFHAVPRMHREDLSHERLTPLIAPLFATASPLAQEMERLLLSENSQLAGDHFRSELARHLNGIRNQLPASYSLLVQAYVDEIRQQCAGANSAYARLQLEWSEEHPERALEAVQRRMLNPDALLAQAQSQFAQHAPDYQQYAAQFRAALDQIRPFSNISEDALPSARAIAYQEGLIRLRQHTGQLIERSLIDPNSIAAKTTRAAGNHLYQGAIAPVIERTQTQLQPTLNQVNNAMGTVNAAMGTVQSGIDMVRPIVNWIAPSAARSNDSINPPAQTPSIPTQSSSTSANPATQPPSDPTRPNVANPNPPQSGLDARDGGLTLSAMVQFAMRHLLSTEGNPGVTERLFSIGILLSNVLGHAQRELARHSNQNPAFTPISEALTGCIGRLQEAVANRDPQVFQQVLSEGLAVLEQVRVYGNTHSLPSGMNFLTIPLSGLINSLFGEGTPNEPALDELPLIPLGAQVEALGNAIQNTPPPRAAINPASIDGEIRKQKEIFVANTTNTVSLKIICSFCRVKSEGIPLYLEMIREANSLPGVKNSKSMWQVVERKLEEQKVGWTRRKAAQVLFYVCTTIVKSIVQRAMTRALKRFFKWTKKNRGTHFDPFRNQLIHNTNSYITILNGLYRQLGARQEFTGEVKSEVAKHLEMKKYNGGYTNKELYSKFTDVALKLISKNAFFDLFNGITLLKFVVRKIIGKEALVKNIVSSGSDFLVDQNGYSHALNCVLYDQLLDIWNQLNLPNARPNNDAEILRNLSDNVKKEITGLVRNFNEFLYIDPNATPGDLHAMVNRSSPLDIAQRTADSLFIDQVILAASDQFAVAFHTLLNENKIKQLFYDLTSKINDNYNKGEAIPRNEYDNKEAQLRELIQQIITFIVRKSVNESLQFTREDEQRQVNQVVGELKADIEGNLVEEALRDGFLPNTQMHLQELAAMGDLTTPEARRKVLVLGETSQAFVHKWHRKCTEIRGARMSEENKAMLLNLIDTQLSRQLTGFHRELTRIVERSNDIDASSKIANAFRESGNALGTIANILRSPNPLASHDQLFRNAIAEIERHCESLGQDPSAALLRESANAMSIEWHAVRDQAGPREHMLATIARFQQEFDTIRGNQAATLVNRQGELHQLIRQAQAAIAPMQNWMEESLRPTAFLNLSILPNGRIRRQATALVYRRIHHKFSRLLDFLRDPILCYKFGLNHLMLIPAVGKKS